MMSFFLNDDRFIYESLLRWNYFPSQKEGINELPPYFKSHQFTPEIAEIIDSEKNSRFRNSIGYDHISYQATRHNNVPRSLAILHPKPYASLCKHIHSIWDEIKPISENNNSLIKPSRHLDGRVIIMNYEDQLGRADRDLRLSFGKKFKAKTDISNCFSSIYTHSIEWAIIGFEESKNLLLSKTNHWAKELDSRQRKVKRNETQGIPIGPSTSNIFSEIILSNIDNSLRNNNFNFYRYIDDYTCFCDTYEEAQNFINYLNNELNKYRLNLNLLKTSIVELPEPINSEWVTLLTLGMPSNYIDSSFNKRELTSFEISHFLDYAIRINKETPDGSVLKYAIGLIMSKLSGHQKTIVINYIINLSYHYPILIPYLSKFDSTEMSDDYAESLYKIILENLKYKRSDGICWPIYILHQNKRTLPKEIAEKIIESNDSLSILSLYYLNGWSKDLRKFIDSIVSSSLYTKDQHWLLLYYLYKEKLICNPYPDQTFEVLEKYDVTFIDSDEKKLTKAESYCDIFANPFHIGPIPSFESYMNASN